MATRLEMKRGDTKKMRVVVRDRVTNDPVDLTGASLTFAVKRHFTDPVVLISKSTGAGTISLVGGPETGEVRWSIDPVDTESLEPDPLTLFWDLELLKNAERYTVDSGTLDISPDIARNP